MKESKILLLSTYDFAGAGVGALMMLDELKANGFDATLLVDKKKSNRSDVLSFWDLNQPKAYFFLKRIKDSVCRKWERYKVGNINPEHSYSFNNSHYSSRRILKKYGKTPDVIVVCWVKDFIGTNVIKKLHQKTNAKIVYAMMDNAPITGGCHYPIFCQEYKKKCFNCIALKKNRDIAAKILSEKKHDLNTVSPYIIGTTSDCMRARESFLFKGCKVFEQLNLNSITSKLSKQDSRKKWGLKENDFIIFFGAHNVLNKRKGFSYLLEAANHIVNNICEESNITFLIAGDNGNLDSFPSKLKYKYVGKLSLDELFMAFTASDIYISSSIEDSGPMMINYSIALGVPVISFKIGVALDLVIPNQTGILVDNFNSIQMAEAMLQFYRMNKATYKNMQQECRLLYNRLKEEKSISIIMDKIITD